MVLVEKEDEQEGKFRALCTEHPLRFVPDSLLVLVVWHVAVHHEAALVRNRLVPATLAQFGGQVRHGKTEQAPSRESRLEVPFPGLDFPVIPEIAPEGLVDLSHFPGLTDEELAPALLVVVFGLLPEIEPELGLRPGIGENLEAAERFLPGYDVLLVFEVVEAICRFITVKPGKNGDCGNHVIAVGRPELRLFDQNKRPQDGRFFVGEMLGVPLEYRVKRLDDGGGGPDVAFHLDEFVVQLGRPQRDRGQRWTIVIENIIAVRRKCRFQQRKRRTLLQEPAARRKVI